MNEERWKEIESRPLLSGAHKDITEGGCIMEMVSYLAGEPWSDSPECACPILTGFAIRLNDRFTDEHRQLLKPLIPLLVNTKATDIVRMARRRLIRWHNVTVLCPMILEALKLPELATELREFENNLDSMALAAKFLRKHAMEINKAGGAHSFPYSYSYADTIADTIVVADAITDAYADAYAWRSQIATVAIEMLRLAIEVKS